MYNGEKELIAILDFGGQYNQLIARRVREHNVYCEVFSFKTSIEDIKLKNPKGIIFTGGPSSIYSENAPRMGKEILELGIPVLGICYGLHFMIHALNGDVEKASETSEFGRADCRLDLSSLLFDGLAQCTPVWMSHNDCVKNLPDGFKSIADTDNCENAAVSDEKRKLYGVQFHPEVNHTVLGSKIIGNFLIKICGCKCGWTMKNYAEQSIAELKEKIGSGKVLLALSGGVDSSVSCELLAKAIGSRLNCIFVDHGFMRKNEGDEVESVFGNKDINFIRVNAGERFLKVLKGVTDPEKKRKLIGEEFIRVFEEEAKKIGSVDFLVQGTIYPDVIESGLGDAALIKSHHNVGGLPDYVDFKEIIEPLRMLFKDEVRKLGKELGLPENLVNRQPFPGPGLAVRVIGELTFEKLEILRDADLIFREEVANAGLSGSIDQYFAVLTDMRSVGVMGDDRTYDYTLALRGVNTTDFMTADFARIPYDVLERTSVRIVNEVKGINRICYDVTSKPPATIEWE